MDPFGDINKYPTRVRQENHFSWGHKFTSDDGDGGLNPQAISLGYEEELHFRSCDRVDLLPVKSISLTQRPWRRNVPHSTRSYVVLQPQDILKSASIWSCR